MTEHEQRVTLARWMGDSCQSCQQPLSDEMLPDTCSCKVPQVPDYTRDLNAMHEAEKQLISQGVWRRYKDEVWRIFTATDPWPKCSFCGDDVLFATAAQRAKALLRTLGLWKGDAP